MRTVLGVPPACSRALVSAFWTMRWTAGRWVVGACSGRPWSAGCAGRRRGPCRPVPYLPHQRREGGPRRRGVGVAQHFENVAHVGSDAGISRRAASFTLPVHVATPGSIVPETVPVTAGVLPQLPPLSVQAERLI